LSWGQAVERGIRVIGFSRYRYSENQALRFANFLKDENFAQVAEALAPDLGERVSVAAAFTVMATVRSNARPLSRRAPELNQVEVWRNNGPLNPYYACGEQSFRHHLWHLFGKLLPIHRLKFEQSARALPFRVTRAFLPPLSKHAFSKY
jgi:hypothetical protein